MNILFFYFSALLAMPIVCYVVLPDMGEKNGLIGFAELVKPVRRHFLPKIRHYGFAVWFHVFDYED